ncbi:hypothetical protein B0T11DRAFT_315320, partial [Plectosphaerella cucumerina]
MSRASIAATTTAALSTSTQFCGPGPLGVSKRSRYGTAVFVKPNVRRLRSATTTTLYAPTTFLGLKRPGSGARRPKTPAAPTKAEKEVTADDENEAACR